jgi:branched-chain amino acid transport system substrate-binding protein
MISPAGKRSRKRTVAACAAVLAAAATLSACASSNSSKPDTGAALTTGGGSTINILDITATSGATAIYGTQETDGLEAAAAYYNAHGGILGKKISVTVENDNSDPATAASILTQQLSSNPGKWTMVWAGEEGTVSAALVPILKHYDVFGSFVDDGNGACALASACPNLFMQSPPINVAEVADAAALKKAGYTKVGIIADQATYDQSELSFMTPDLAKDGIKYDTVSFPSSAVSLTPEMSQLKSDGAQAVFALALGPAAGYVLQARAALGWSVPVEFDVTGSSTDIASLVPAGDLTNVTETIQYCEDTQHANPAFASMVKYTPHSLAGNIICSIAGDGWGGTVLLAEAAAKAKSLSANALGSAAQTLTITNNEVSYTTKCWTPADHEDSCEGPAYYEIVAAGQLKNTRLYPLG